MLTKTEIIKAMDEICVTIDGCQDCIFSLNTSATAQNGKLSQCIKKLVIDSMPQKMQNCGREL